MAMPAVSRSAVHTTPARPSISPLSTASKAFKSSPIATRDAAMKDNAAQELDEVDDTSESGDAEIGEHHDDHSSSLSEPEDDNEDVEEGNGVDDDTLNGDEAAAHQLLDDDSEAETERLEQTPQKLRKHGDGLGRTPSKLNQAATAEDDLSEPLSPLAIGVGAASSTSTVATAGQKRKRSETAESSLTSADSELGESPRKKTHETPSHALDDVDDPLETAAQSTESAEHAEDTPAIDDTRSTPTVRGRGGFRGRGRGRHMKKRKEQIAEPEVQTTEEVIEPEEEPSEEKVAKTEEEIKAKKEASTTYEDVTKQFRFFREKLNTEQLATLTSELRLLSASNCEHPEYVKQVVCVDARLQKQRSEAHAYFNYRLRSIRERTLGERTQLHSQYYQSGRELREDVLYKLGEDWYAIQKERRQSHQEKDEVFIYKFPTDKRVQKRNQAKYNQEVSVLSGMAKWVGFPAAPEIDGVDGDSFEDDMKAMKISKRAHQSTAAAPRQVYYPGPSAATAMEQNERLAQERFMEQNPWARPQAPTHTHGTPGISHTPDWAEPNAGGYNSAKYSIPNFFAQMHRTTSDFFDLVHQNTSPHMYATPLTQKRPLAEQNSSAGTLPLNSDGPEPPSSVIAAPQTTGRIELMNQGSNNQTSPVTYAKVRQPGQGGNQAGLVANDIRNISGVSAISGASTIDAPQEPNPPQDRQTEAAKSGLPALMHVSSASHTVFDTSQLHRHPRDEIREVYPNAGFRPQEGAFGTPAPLPPGDGRP